MKKIFCLAIVLAVFVNVNTFSATRKSNSNKKNSSSQINSEAAQVALKFLKEYTEVLENNTTGIPNDVSNPEDYDVEYIYFKTTDLITERFRNELLKLTVECYSEEDGCGADLITGHQYYDPKLKILSYNSNKGIVIIQGVDMPDFKVKVKVKNVNGKWLVDNSGAPDMVDW